MERVVIFGSGNVATHIARHLDNVCDITQIVSRNIEHANNLAKQLRKATATNNPDSVDSDADIYIISITDNSIKDIVRQTPENGLWLHTSGSTSIDVFDGVKKHYGVLYPLQTFSKNSEINMAEIPLFIEGNHIETTSAIEQFAKKISSKVYYANSIDRQQLHIAAVFACNFANHLWSIADDILNNSGYDFSVLIPLLKATLDKSITISPSEGQTGPARRGDINIINDHIKLLDKHKAEIYKILSQSILSQYHVPKCNE